MSNPIAHKRPKAKRDTLRLCPSLSCSTRLLAALMLSLPTLAGADEQNGTPEQVIVSVKIIEFQATKGVETGLSAYFARMPRLRPFGRVRQDGASVNTADLTFPSTTARGITVFLDRLRLNAGNIEVLLQALVNENRAFILSKPRAMVMVGETTPTIVKTAQEIPYESTVVVGSTAVQVTAFEETGVILELTVPEVIDDDGDWTTREDTYVHLNVKASVKEEGQRIVVALDDQLAAGGDFSQAGNAISVPEFIQRSIDTHVWVRDGQVLMMGGLYRNTESKNLSTVPWLTQGEDFATNLLNRAIPGNLQASPISSTLGNRTTSEARRELVFLIKSEIWRPAFTIADDLGFVEGSDDKQSTAPVDVIRGPLGDAASVSPGGASPAKERNTDDLESLRGRRDE